MKRVFSDRRKLKTERNYLCCIGKLYVAKELDRLNRGRQVDLCSKGPRGGVSITGEKSIQLSKSHESQLSIS